MSGSETNGEASPSVVYGWVVETRKQVLAYCESLPPQVYAQERSDFGRGSIRNVLVHTADCYRFWLAETALGRSEADYDPKTCPDVSALARLFGEADRIAADLMAAFPGSRFSERLALRVRWQAKPFVTTPLWLLTHTVTHEFHHKGQIVTMGRVLGYPPPETDLVGPRL